MLNNVQCTYIISINTELQTITDLVCVVEGQVDLLVADENTVHYWFSQLLYSSLPSNQ